MGLMSRAGEIIRAKFSALLNRCCSVRFMSTRKVGKRLVDSTWLLNVSRSRFASVVVTPPACVVEF